MADDPIDREEVARITGRGRWALALGLGCVMGSLAAFGAAYRLHVDAEWLELYESALSDDLEPGDRRAWPPRARQRGYFAWHARQRRGNGRLAAAVGVLLLPIAGAAFAVRRSKS